MFLLGHIAAILMGLSLGLIGGGGSILTVPILVYFFNQDPLAATTNSLFIVGVTALVGALINFKKGYVDLKTGFVFALPSFLGIFVTRHYVLPFLPETIFKISEFSMTKSLLVMFAFSILMIWASKAMILSSRSYTPASDTGNSNLQNTKINIFGILNKGFLVGCTTGFVGAGGGFLIIPSLVIMLKIPIRKAIGTSLTIIAINSLFGFWISPLIGKSTDWRLLFSVSFLGVIGLFVGQIYSSRVPENFLKKGFGFFVLGVGSLMLIDQLT